MGAKHYVQRGQHTPGPLDAVREAADAALVDLLAAPPCAGSRRTAADAARAPQQPAEQQLDGGVQAALGGSVCTPHLWLSGV